MMPLEATNDCKYFNAIDDCKPELIPIKCWSLLQFFKLDGRKSILSRESMISIPGLQYVVEAKAENRFYLRTYRGYTIDLLYFYYDGMGSTDEAVENLRQYVSDGTVTLMFTPAMVEDMKQMLRRVYKSHLSGDKTIDYKDYINLLDRTLALEDFKRVGAVTGYKTVINQFELEIKEIWKNVFEKTNK